MPVYRRVLDAYRVVHACPGAKGGQKADATTPSASAATAPHDTVPKCGSGRQTSTTAPTSATTTPMTLEGTQTGKCLD